MANIRKRSENSYQITVSCGYANGRKLRKAKTVTLPDTMTEKQRKKELERQAVLFEREVETGQFLDGENITFAEFTQRWLVDYAEKQLAPGTLKPYKMRLKERILPAIGHYKLSKLQPHHLMKFYNNLREDGIRRDGRYTPTQALLALLDPITTPALVALSGVSFKTCQSIKKGSPTTCETAEKICTALGVDMKKMFAADSGKLSDKTIRHHHGIICSILSTAVKWNLITNNPALRVDMGKAPKYKPDYYDDEQIAAMLAALEHEPLRYKAMIFLTVDTGMRTGELTGLTWNDINLDNNTVTIDKQRQYVSGYGTIERIPKTENAYRTITLSETVTALMRQYKLQQMEDKLRLGSAWVNDNHVFLHEDGSPINPHRPYKWLTAFLKRHGLPKITYHQLRHTNASLLISAGFDVVTLSGRLGHGDKNITLNTYSHIIKSREAQAANRMDMFYAKVTPAEIENA